MAAGDHNTKDIWELLSQKAKIDAAIAEKRRELQKVLTQGRKSRRKKVRTYTLTEPRRTARAA